MILVQHQRARLIGFTALLLAGCHSSPPPTANPASVQSESPMLTEATFYLAGMNESLQIL